METGSNHLSGIAEEHQNVEKHNEPSTDLLGAKKRKSENTSNYNTQTMSEVEKIEQQILDEDEDMYQSINAELDKQIAEDMEAIKTYLNSSDESVAKRIEFFNQMDKTKVHCTDAPITDHILYQHTPLGNIKWHECIQCDYKSQEKSLLMEHLMTSHSSLTNPEQLACLHCSFKTSTNSDLQKHLYDIHNKGQTFSCNDCDKIFYINSDLLKHMEEVHEVEIFRCHQCTFISKDTTNLRQHTMTEHIKLNVSWYKCAQCAYRTVRKANLDRHIMYKHSINTILL